jgi:Lon protease-like protein
MGDPSQRIAIPIFPLANVVLFPGVQVPLHVFEPRYRAMTADALSGGRVIGMVSVRHDARDGEDEPAVYPLGCAGTILGAEQLEDGRYNIVLAGTQRFRIEHELPRPTERLYRVAEVTLLQEVLEPGDAPRLRDARREVVSLFSELVRITNPDRASEINDELFATVDDAVFTNTFCQLLELEPLEKQSLLQTDRVADRCGQLGTLLRFRLAELSGQIPDAERHLH